MLLTRAYCRAPTMYFRAPSRQAEIYSVYLALDWLKENNMYEIRVDRQSALKIIFILYHRSEVAYKVMKNLPKYGGIKLKWIKAHIGV